MKTEQCQICKSVHQISVKVKDKENNIGFVVIISDEIKMPSRDKIFIILKDGDQYQINPLHALEDWSDIKGVATAAVIAFSSKKNFKYFENIIIDKEKSSLNDNLFKVFNGYIKRHFNGD